MNLLPWSFHKSPGYRGQLARLERWYDRARHATSTEDVEDYLYAFFQGCHHLREWLPEAEFPSERVRRFLDESVELKICRDLANLAKHRELNRTPATNAEPAVARVFVAGRRGWFGKDAALVVLTDLSDRPFDLLELARCCLALWREFLDPPA